MRPLLIALPLFLFLSCGGNAWKNKREKRERPNILLFIADDQSWPHTSAYGDNAISTPGFDRIAGEGVLFNHAFAASPGCSPSRASLLTGLNCWQLEEAGTHASSFPTAFKAFPDLLEAAGYAIGFTGKGWAPGDYRTSGRKRNPAGPAFSSREMDSPKGISAVDYTANFIEFLEQRDDDRPFFFWVGTHEPHRAYEKGIGRSSGMRPDEVIVPDFLPDVAEVRSDLLDYGFEIQWADVHLQRILKVLDERGELDNTLIVYTSDNGMPFPRAKANVYEYGIHVPLAIRWGNQVTGGRVSDDLVSLMDLFPTFLDVAQADYPNYRIEGKSLLDGLTGVSPFPRDAVYASRERHSSSRWNNLGYPQRCIRTKQYLYIRNFAPERWPAGDPRQYDETGQLGKPHGAYHDIDDAAANFLIREGNDSLYADLFRLAVGKRPAEELYDITTDPACLVNIAGDTTFTEELLELRHRLGGYLMQTSDPRVIGNGEAVFERYPRLSGPIRQFPHP
ncbi:sulfatase family protein [Parapedobacter sp. DT-150]|uniref:sulfatase family protein n=1 Tax=Parapedobacter sp. DT-150 TaxID=3396162 RepID=UPI003F19AAF0